MSKGKARKGNDNRRKEQFADLQRRAAEAPQPDGRREHIQPVDITDNEAKYEPLLFAIESALVEVFEERGQLPIDAEAERALRVVIVRFEGDADRRSGSPNVDAMADRINRNIKILFRRHPLLSRAEIIGCLRRIISSIATWHTPENPRAYFAFVGEMVQRAARESAREETPARSPSGLWLPGQSAADVQDEERSHTQGGLWIP